MKKGHTKATKLKVCPHKTNHFYFNRKDRKMKEANYYAIIPANVRYDKDLSANAKLLYGEIIALSNGEGYCWATNSYFANLYNVKNIAVSRWISQLVKKGYIKSVIIYRNGTKEIESRRLYIEEYKNQLRLLKLINLSLLKLIFVFFYLIFLYQRILILSL